MRSRGRDDLLGNKSCSFVSDISHGCCWESRGEPIGQIYFVCVGDLWDVGNTDVEEDEQRES